MNRIHSPLGGPGNLKAEDILWEQRRDKRNRCCDVPAAPVSERRTAMIWTSYFELLFLRFHLLERFINHSEELKKKANAFYLLLYPNGTDLDRVRLLKLLIEAPQNNTLSDIAIDEAGKDVVAEIFDYTYLAKEYREELAAFVELLDVKVCPYCGRTFTTTVRMKHGRYIRSNQLDHYYPKTVYPWLALSIWNLIPVCGPCNNRKGDETEPILYPYGEAMGDDIRFRTHPVSGLSYLVGAQDSEEEFRLALEPEDKTKASSKQGLYARADNEIAMLGINELYSTHKDYVCRIFRQRYIFGPPYIDELVENFKDLFPNRDEVRATLYMKRIDAEHIGDAPLDKLTRDINNEIDRLTDEMFEV